jgi:hypothetical protein
MRRFIRLRRKSADKWRAGRAAAHCHPALALAVRSCILRARLHLPIAAAERRVVPLLAKRLLSPPATDSNLG